jgi:hypothetical protein
LRSGGGQPLGNGFLEIVTPSFFNKSKGDGYPGVTARYQHDPLYVLGSTESGTLRLTVDSRGLDYEVDLPQTRGDVLELVSRKDVRSSSFAFQSFDDTWDYEDGMALRTLLSGRLIDVAPVTNAAYTQSSVSLRSLARFMDAPIEDVERYSASGELRRFFTRSDRPAGALTGAQLRSKIMRMRYPAQQKTANQRVIEIEGRRWPYPPRSAQQRQIDLLEKRRPL